MIRICIYSWISEMYWKSLPIWRTRRQYVESLEMVGCLSLPTEVVVASPSLKGPNLPKVLFPTSSQPLHTIKIKCQKNTQNLVLLPLIKFSGKKLQFFYLNLPLIVIGGWWTEPNGRFHAELSALWRNLLFEILKRQCFLVRWSNSARIKHFFLGN